MLKVGIPRALLYYEYYPFWKTFFEELGAKIIVSDKTSKNIMDEGVKSCVDEACLPVKIFQGHVLNLCGKVDYIFVPRLTSVAEGEYICPKFGGLPDMLKSLIPNIPKLITTEINSRNSFNQVYKAIKEIGWYFTKDIDLIESAYNKAVQIHLDYKRQFEHGIPEFINNRSSKNLKEDTIDTLNIGILGHPYNVYDSFINMDLINKLQKEQVCVITPEMINENLINQKSQMLRKHLFWTFGRRIFGSAMCMLDMENVHGIVYLMSFGCGIDSFICDMVERRVRKAGIPFSVLVLDEHTGEAGFNTRIEAFIDMIRWEQKNENYISTYG